MSEQEKKAVVGALVIERAEVQRRQATMKEYLELLHKAFVQLADGLGYNVNPAVNRAAVQRYLAAEPLSQYDFAKLTSFLEEYAAAAERIMELNGRLRELGID